MTTMYYVTIDDGLKTTAYRFFDLRRLARWLRTTSWIRRIDRVWEEPEP